MLSISCEEWPSERILPSLKGTMCTIGIDEAGRGPVLGPLVYGLCICGEESSSWLNSSNSGADDSKNLSKEQRESFFKSLLDDYSINGDGGGPRMIGWLTKAVHPAEISYRMMSKSPINYLNLNELSYSTVYSLLRKAISAIGGEVFIERVYVDTLGKPEKYTERLEEKFPLLKGKFTVKSKADSLFPVVGAASIIAKVLRDHLLTTMVSKVEDASDFPVPSGYPGDQSTVNFLKRNIIPLYGFPDSVRFSWGSCKGFLEDQCYPIKWCDSDIPSISESLKKKKDFNSIINNDNNNIFGLLPSDY